MDATADDIKALSLSDPKLCQALNLSDSKPCRDPATNINELFCRFHARQCFGLYKGYKRRNAELDSLARKEPAFLRRSKTSLINQNFDAVVDEKELQEIHSYLFTQSVLLRKVITARNVHHTHFYPQKMDYGHKAYLDKLVTRHQAVQKALGSLERRTAELVFKKEKWYDWVSKAQDEEEANREKEQQKVKLEADLFRRHWRGMEARLKAAREREEKRRQEAYLEEVWRERMASQDSSDESDTDWDPIEDVYQDNREKFLDLIRHFLWMEMPTTEATDDTPRPGSPRPETPRPETEGNLDPVHLGEPSEPAAAAELTGGDTVATAIDDSTTQKKRRRGKNKGKPQKSKTGSPVSTVASGQKTKNDPASKTQESQPDKSNIESMEEVRQRLREGVAKDYSHVRGPMVVGTSQIPHELYERTAPVAEEDIQRLMSEITEIKLLLFCRQLLSHPKLLPAALRAADIDDFLSDTSISEADLRDLCLRVERPSLQALRDACADFARGDEPDDDDDDEEPVYQSASQSLRHHIRYSSLEDEGCLPGTALLDGMLTLNMRTLLDGSGPMNGDLREEAKEQKTKIKVCGKSIWNHASQSSMARDGWLHFSIMAKDCSFHDAMSLCRNWDEFFDLHILAGWQYFPASRWTTWSGSMLMEELISMGFVPFYKDMRASRETTYNQLPRVSRRRLDREPLVIESRNVVCAYMKRNDPVSRRFIQYVLMQRGEALILVRDGKTGKIVVAPDEDERWLVRAIPGYMAPLPGEKTLEPAPWRNVTEVGPEFFDEAEENQTWQFGFDSYYEVYMWDFAPGEDGEKLYRLISEALLKARRIRGLRDKYKHQEHITRCLTRDKDSQGVRQIRPGEQVTSLHDELTSSNASFWIRTKYSKMVHTTEDLPPGESLYTFYNDADAAEDEVLFEAGLPDNFPFIEISSPLHMFETGRMPPSILNYEASVLRKVLLPKKTDNAVTELDDELEPNDSADGMYAPGSKEFNYFVPPLWEQAHGLIKESAVNPARVELLRRLDFASVQLRIPLSGLGKHLGNQEIMERDRSYVFKDTFHLSDLEEGGPEKYATSARLIRGIQNFTSSAPSVNWAWFCMETLDWMHLKLHYSSYTTEPLKPWPHRYMAHDITQAFVTMALFFPDLDVTSVIREYLDTEEGSAFRDSPIFDPAARSRHRPDCRTRTSNKFRPSSFWSELDKLKKSKKPIFDIYPMEGSLAIRPIIAKLYRGGAVGPAPLQPSPVIVPGFATANTEPHRPNKPDLFIHYDWSRNTPALPVNYIDYTDWPDLLPLARSFAARHPTSPRFALIRLWSAPHFYPLMMMIPTRQPMSFLDPAGRAWEWKFLPKDMPESEWSIHNTVRLRLGCLRQAIMGVSDAELASAAIAASRLDGETGKAARPRGKKTRREVEEDKLRARVEAQEKWKADGKWNYGTCELDGRVFHRGDLVLVMGTDQMDLLKWCTAVVFAFQTKPWFREVDLWKSFVNVDLGFLERLDEFWLGHEVPSEVS